ncbi:PREDICTED: fatty acyl-CoA reductase 1-like [Habropoda laboriosa]|uniref:fatty acyl-CoA reductase 1-like n=1 Tax=Habropoda laboriosa TaxID=597456 RepID=UPI00083DC4E6|nr:PREDICTED: fatty acyl-CoA reductase 1-like [Habropoda laboriosa]
MNDIHATSQLDEKEDLKNNDDSQIRKFYAGKCIFLTGCIGFLGSVILEKILRTCVDIGKVYVMIRPKKGMSMEDRVKERFRNVLFDKVHQLNPNFVEKIVPIYGDLQKTDLALSPEDRRCLIENVDIIIHNASLVYFEAKASHLLRANVIGTQKMLELATECYHLKAFVYVSTAYSHLYNKVIEEKFYPPPADVKLIEQIIRADEEKESGLSKDEIHDIVGQWTNLYTFSKATTEGVVQDFGRTSSFSCLVYRPSIVTPPYVEPLPGWIGNKNGPVVLTLGISLGIVHVVNTQEDILALIWDSVIHGKFKGPQVYNCASSDWNPVTFGLARAATLRAAYKFPSLKMAWYPFLVYVPNFPLLVIFHVLFHILPAIIVDIVLLAQRKTPMAISAVWRVTKFSRILSHFISSSWIIKSDNLKDVQTRMNAADLKEFPFDLNVVDWYRLIESALLGFRSMLHDTPESLPAAKRKYQRLMIIHYIICGLLVLLLLYFLYRTMCSVFCYW